MNNPKDDPHERSHLARIAANINRETPTDANAPADDAPRPRQPGYGKRGSEALR